MYGTPQINLPTKSSLQHTLRLQTRTQNLNTLYVDLAKAKGEALVNMDVYQLGKETSSAGLSPFSTFYCVKYFFAHEYEN